MQGVEITIAVLMNESVLLTVNNETHPDVVAAIIDLLREDGK